MSIFKMRNLMNPVNIAVQNGEVVIKTPNYLTREDVENILQDIKETIARRQEKYIQNEVVKILGEYCKVQINYKNLEKPVLTVEGKNIKISLPNKYKRLNKEEIVVKLIEKLYMLIAEKEVEDTMEKYRNLLGIAPEDYIIRKENKMAQCTRENVIIINPMIVTYSKEVIEYIILHQFCHLKFKTHCNGFNDMLRKYMPNYKIIEKQLKNCAY